MHMFANAMRNSEGDEIAQIMPQLCSEFDAPQGRVRIDPPTITRACTRACRAEATGQFKIVREARRPVHPDPYMVTHSLGGWTAKLAGTTLNWAPESVTASVRRRDDRATPPQLKELRTLRVAVLHPDDADGRQLTQQLQRIGCQVQAFLAACAHPSGGN